MNWLTKPAASLLLSASLLAGGLAACSKGDELSVALPGAAAIGTNYLDLPLRSFQVVQQPIQTIKAQHYLVGRLQDQLTGTTTAQAALNLLAAFPNDSLPGRFVVDGGPDSVVVNLGYDQLYGSAAQPARFDLFELDQPLDERTVYNSTTVPATKSPAVATNLTVPLNRTVTVRQPVAGSPGDSVTNTVANQTVALVVQRKAAARVNPAANPAIASDWATRIFRALQVASLSQAQLDAAVRGLLLAPSAGYSGAILSFSRTPVGALSFYFRELGTGKRHSYRVFFGPALSGAGPGAPLDPRYFTLLSTDFRTTSGSGLNGLAPGTRRSPIPSASGNSLIGYLQEGTGLGLAVQFNTAGFDVLTRPGVAINRAELILPVQPYSNSLFSRPANIYAVEVDANNQPLQRVNGLIVTDRIVQADGVAQTGSGAQTTGILVNPNSTSAYYSLPITSYLQAYLNNPTANTLGGPLPDALLITPALSNAPTLTLNRAAIRASDATLRVYYTQLRQ